MTTAPSPLERPKDWVNIVFLTLTPLIAIPGLIWYTYMTGLQLWMPLLFLGMYILAGLSVCAGYHRFFAHKSYDCAPVVQYGLAFFGAMAAQNSILTWSAGHRRHHAYSETEWDPYTITRGFWWAHMFWIFYKDPEGGYIENVRDLQKNPVVAWQHRWYRAILMAGGFGLPMLIGALCGNAIAGLLWGGFLRIVVVHHSTFFVNSLAHSFGSKAYDEESTARDNWFVALLTFGEGYHSFHHRFPADFRNGIRWFSWDPAKWFISAMSWAGLASKLRTTAAPAIERARMEVAVKRIEAHIEQSGHTRGAEIRAQIAKARDAFTAAAELWQQRSVERAKGRTAQWKAIGRSYHLRIVEARREWRHVLLALKTFSEGSTEQPTT